LVRVLDPRHRDEINQSADLTPLHLCITAFSVCPSCCFVVLHAGNVLQMSGGSRSGRGFLHWPSVRLQLVFFARSSRSPLSRAEKFEPVAYGWGDAGGVDELVVAWDN